MNVDRYIGKGIQDLTIVQMERFFPLRGANHFFGRGCFGIPCELLLRIEGGNKDVNQNQIVGTETVQFNGLTQLACGGVGRAMGSASSALSNFGVRCLVTLGVVGLGAVGLWLLAYNEKGEGCPATSAVNRICIHFTQKTFTLYKRKCNGACRISLLHPEAIS